MATETEDSPSSNPESNKKCLASYNYGFQRTVRLVILVYQTADVLSMFLSIIASRYHRFALTEG